MRTLSNFRLHRYTVLLFLYLATLPLGHAQIAAGTFSIADGGQQKRFAIAEDELYCTPGDGSAAHFKQLDAAADPRTAVSRAARQNASSDDQYDLVLYPDGATRCRSNRRILRRKLLVELFDRDAAKKIYAQSRAIAYQIPKYAPDFVILEFPAAGDSLEHLGAVRALAGVKSANPLLAKFRNKRSTPNDPLLLYSATNPGYQWHLKNSGANGGIAGIDVNIEPLWDRYSGAGVTVGVVDDGLQLDHPDLAANTNNNLHKDWNGSDRDPSPESEDTHGTPCAGVVAAVAGNQQGGVGAAPQAQLVGLRLIAAAVSDQQEAEAMNWETAQAILIKSNSWGPNDADGELEAAGPLVQSAFIDSTRNGRGGRGTVHVWAAGNGGDDDNVNYDGYANSIYTIAIGAVNDKGQRSGYSEPGAAKVVSAPSDGDFDDQGITTTDINSNYRYDFGGTSSATPLAAGVIALMLEANPDLGWRDVQEILIRCARQLRPDDAGWHLNAAKIPFSHDFGAGLIDAALAIELAEDWTNLGAQQSITLTDSAPLAIPDQDSAGVEKTFTIEANDSFRVEHVSLTVDIAHPDRSNLTISLISPGGTESVLALPQETFANKANYDNWTFMTVHNWGEQAAGSWTLKVVDSVHSNVGSLNTATLQVYGASNPAPRAPSIHWAQGVRGLVGRSFYLKALAPQGVVTYQASNLPAGLSLNTQTGAISGTPTASGAFPVTLAATNSHGSTAATFDLHIDALEINSALHANAVVGRSYSYQIQTSDSTTAFSAAGLPDGLSVDPHSGLISGVPTQIGSFLITLGASNASGSALATLALNVTEGASLTYGTALDNELQTFDAEPLDAEPLWINQSAVSMDGIDALQSPAIADGQFTAFSTTVHASGVLEFYAKTSTEADYDLLEVTVDGVRLLELSGAHEWKKYSYNLINNSTQKIIWKYTKNSDYSAGMDQVWIDQVVFTPTVFANPIVAATDFAGLNWPSSTDWSLDVTTSYDSEDALKTAPRGDGGATSLSVSMVGPGTLSFYYKVSSEPEYDFFRFKVGEGPGAERLNVSGAIDWTLHSERIPSGPQTVVWEYAKDESESEGDDCAWIDQVRWVADSASAFENWQKVYFTPTELQTTSISDALMDPDHDGMTNLEEYAYGNHPHAGLGDYPPRIEINSTALDLYYQVDSKRSAEVTVSGEYSPDLKNWSPWASSVHSESDDVQIRQLSVPRQEGQKGFLRLTVEALPSP